jgi:acetylornithine deacetylase/succinyl-diaminopimelate desuccinylase-like protein
MSTSSVSDQATVYQRPVELLQNLIRFNTTNPPGNEADCIAYINNLLNIAGIETTILARHPARPNLMARLTGQGKVPPLLLQGHVDVVTTENQTWQHPPFEARLADGCIWGRGALDMKGGVAMMLAAFLRLKAEGPIPPGDVVLAILADEEEGSDYGARYLVENHPGLFQGIRYALGEIGGLAHYFGRKKFYPIRVADRQRGWIQIRVRGLGGHSGVMSIRGGAMAKLAQTLQRLEQHRWPVHVIPVTRHMIETMASNLSFPSNLLLRCLLKPACTDPVLRFLGTRGQALQPLLHNTVNATIVHGGEKFNVIPSEVVIDLDARVLPGYSPEEFMAELRQAIGNDVEAEIRQFDECPGSVDMGLFSTLADVLREADPSGVPLPMLMSTTSDARFFSRLGIQTYGFTPMNLPPGFNYMELFHGPNERAPAEAIIFGTSAIFNVMQRFGG